jgi:hypothetical protein
VSGALSLLFAPGAARAGGTELGAVGVVAVGRAGAFVALSANTVVRVSTPLSTPS